MTKSRVAVLPFLKWAGGKRWLVDRVRDALPRTFRRYYEPFLGSGAMFFAIRPDSATLSDSNPRLIETYCAIKSDPQKVMKLLAQYQKLHSRDFYYQIREKRCRTPVTRAAQFIYLNRTCWNGLYRVNLSGSFNVPIGTKTSVVLDTDDFCGIQKLILNTIILCCDFEEILDRVGREDFVFLDPPYTVRHNFNGFLKYNERLFSWDDQIRLRAAAERAASRGAYVMITNADHESIRELYADFGHRLRIERASVLAGDRNHRGPIDELMIRSWN